jgi:hypothetical protein
MKKIFYNCIYGFALCSMITTFLMLSACDDDTESGNPVITEVRNYAASPDDTLITTLQPGQWVVLHGQNLTGAQQILFNGVSATFNGGLFSDTRAVVQVPAVIPFPIIPAEKQNTIQYFTENGATTFSFDISAPAPTITAISNENAIVGDSVYIYGTNLFLLTKVIFAGTEITEYSSSPDGTYVSFMLPELEGSGPVMVENKTGGYSTVFNVNDGTGILCNFDDVNTFSWGTGTDNNSTTFPGNKGYYANLKNDGLGAGNWSWWEGGRSINTNGVQWLPRAAGDSLRDPVDEYAFKFEINVPEEWNGTTLFILRDYNWAYVARFEPWNLGNGKTAPVTTNGHWVTVTIPLSQFRTKADGKDGTGAPAATLKQFLGDSGSGSVNMFTVNDSGASVAPLNISIDNIRVVKIM